MTKLSVVLPCFNGAETIAVQLEALANQQWSGSWEVIVSNNGSTDNSVEIVEQYRHRLPSLTIVNAYDPSGPRLGAARSYNVGLAAATGDAFAFCEADDEIAPGWVAAMGEALSKYDFVAGRLEYRKLNPAWLFKHDGETKAQETGLTQHLYPPYLPYASGCNLGMKRSVYQLLGPLYEAVSYVFDADYAWRAQLSGISLHFIPEAVVHYRLRQSFSGMYRQARNWGSDMLFLRLWYGEQMNKWMSLKCFVGVGRQLMKLPFNIHTKAHFGEWIWGLGWKVGLLRGSIKYLLLCKPDAIPRRLVEGVSDAIPCEAEPLLMRTESPAKLNSPAGELESLN